MDSFLYLRSPKGIWEEKGEYWEGRAAVMVAQGTALDRRDASQQRMAG